MLRPYQSETVSRVRVAFSQGARSVLMVAPTGAGKTVMFSYITNSAAAKGRRVMILVHRQELLDQCSRTLTENGVSHGIVASGRSMNQIHPVQVASVQTLVRRLETIVPPDLIICDEAHHSVSGTFKKTLAAFPAARILGTTASPERMDGKGLGSGSDGPFDVMVQGPTAADLIAGGYLSAPVYYAPPSTVDAARIHSVGGDYNRGEAAAEFDKPKITGDAVQHYARIAPGAPAVAFCITIEHAKHVASEFRAAGYRADTIDGTLSDWERRDRVASLADGRLHVLTSCEIINEGFDLPVATVAILLRPTQSLGLHLQQIGRVLRPVYAPGAPLETAEDRLAALKSGPKPQAIILDHVGNLHRHGLAEQPRDWSLDGYCEKRQKKLDEDVLTIRNRQCPKCYAMHAPAPKCPQCGEVYESKREIETVAGELVPLGASAAVRADAWAQCPACQTVHRADLGQCPSCNKDHAKDRRREIGRADTLESLIALGKQRGYKNPFAWASHLMRARGLRAKISKANDGQ
jgi:superfamily II DNA or RNA helicase